METSIERKVSPFTRSCLTMQGYGTLRDEEMSRLNAALRFTPAVCAILIIVGLILQSPTLLYLTAGMGLVGIPFSRGNPVDIFYNAVLRHLWKGEALPANPPQRRFACGLGGAMVAGSATAFVAAMPWLAYTLGGFVAVLSMMVAATHWCFASWLYNRILGKV